MGTDLLSLRRSRRAADLYAHHLDAGFSTERTLHLAETNTNTVKLYWVRIRYCSADFFQLLQPPLKTELSLHVKTLFHYTFYFYLAIFNIPRRVSFSNFIFVSDFGLGRQKNSTDLPTNLAIFS